MADRELKLNSISRFSKQSPRLVLEEHGACEVPAGCGGVILRWRAPHDPVPVKLSLFARGAHQSFLDGAPLASGRPLVAPGEHVLAFQLERNVEGELVLMFAAVAEQPHHSFRVYPTNAPVASLSLLSLPDGSWRYSTVKPPDDSWLRLEYDDSTWLPMVQEMAPEATPREMHNYWLSRLQELSAQPLGVEGDPGAVWIRKRFSLTIHEAA